MDSVSGCCDILVPDVWNVHNQLDCSALNVPISRAEVEQAVFNAKRGKTPGIDCISADVLRNSSCVDYSTELLDIVLIMVLYHQ